MALPNGIFKRKIYGTLLEWKRERNGETAILINGARRIGKSTVAEEFASKEYESYLLIDFTKASEEVKKLFDDLSDLDYIFVRLQLIYNVQLKERRSVIIFDEVQACPHARQAIKHLVADHRYDYIETGSLITIRKNTTGILIPSEEKRIDMFPMDYEEFRWALGDTTTMPLLKEMFNHKQPMGQAAHRKLMRDFRLYMLVGGMPQAVAKYISTNNLREVDLTKRDIIALYEDDFLKIDKTGRATAIYDAVPSQLSRNVSRYQVATAIPDERADRVVSIIAEMNTSMAVNVAYDVADPNVRLALTENLERYKIFANDTGLFVTLAFKDKEFTDNDIYMKLLSDKLSVNLGYVYENVVAQMLRAKGHKLYYHTFLKPDGKNYYEADFLVADGQKISPIEVKSSGYRSHVSLDKFIEKYHSRISSPYLVYTKDLQVDNGITYVPIYMVPFL